MARLTDELLNVANNSCIDIDQRIKFLEECEFDRKYRSTFKTYKEWIKNISLQPSSTYKVRFEEIKSAVCANFDFLGSKEEFFKHIKPSSIYNNQIIALVLYIQLKEQQLMGIQQQKFDAAVNMFSN